VRVFNQKFESIAVHIKQPPGKFSTQRVHLASEKISGVERGATWLLAKAGGIGPEAQAWAAAMLEHRGVEGLRVLQGLAALAAKQGTRRLRNRCQLFGLSFNHPNRPWYGPVCPVVWEGWSRKARPYPDFLAIGDYKRKAIASEPDIILESPRSAFCWRRALYFSRLFRYFGDDLQDAVLAGRRVSHDLGPFTKLAEEPF
jgi:hypothetical protein